MVPSLHKDKMKGTQKSKLQQIEMSMKSDPSYFAHVEALHCMNKSSSRKTQVQSKAKSVQRRRVPMLDQFHPICYPYILKLLMS